MLIRVSSAVLALALLAACNNRSRTRGPRDGSITVDSGASDTGAVDPRCSESPFTFMTCVESQAGVVCPGTVNCECGPQPTTCTCAASADLGFAWQCEDLCDCSPPVDAGTDTIAPPTASCGAVYDRLNDSECTLPFPRESFVSTCEETRGMSATCQMQMDAYLACALVAPIECVDAGGGLIIPNLVGCTAVDEMCLPATP